MKTKYSISLLSLAVFFLISACSKDFLEVSPKGKANSNDFLKTEEEAFMALSGVYDYMQKNYGFSDNWSSAFFIANLRADDCNAGGASGTDQSQLQDIDDFKFSSDNPAVKAMWERYYKAIGASNTIIERTDPNLGDEVVSVLAEAKALRAFNYFGLVINFGGVPLMTVNPIAAADYHKPRASAEAIYQQIETDLKEAIEILPWRSELKSDMKWRFSKGAALSLLGKAYLYQKKYDEAAETFEKVISSGEYGLIDDFGMIWDKSEEFGLESIFEISYTSSEGYTNDNVPWNDSNEANMLVQLMGPRCGNPGIDLTGTGLINGWGFNIATKKIGDEFVAEGDEVRGLATCISVEALEALGGTVYKPNEIWDFEGYVRLKYSTKANQTEDANGVTPEYNYTTNWRLIRYADVLLMAAEAYTLKSGPDLVKANSYLRQVHERAKLTYTDKASASELFDAIVKERMLEFAFEGHRFYDLVRWGLAEQELKPIGFEPNKHELFPIPFDEITANNMISSTDQNPGY